jgi:hypothetical protein
MYVVLALVVGLVVGMATGGRPRYVAAKPFHWLWVLVIGLVLQIVVEVVRLPPWPAFTAVVASYGCLATFALGNFRLRGMGVVAAGLALNLAPIMVDRGMPVRAGALVEAGVARASEVPSFHLGAKRHLETPADTLTVLGDTVPDWVFHEVLSLGDIVMSAGIATLIVHLLRPAARRTCVGDAASTAGAG